MWRFEFDLPLEQNSPDQHEKRVQNGRSATRRIVASRCELPLLGSNQDSPDPESGVLPVTPRGTVPKDYTVGSSGRPRVKNQTVGSGTLRRGTERPVRTVGYHSPLPTPLSRSAPALDTELQAWPLAASDKAHQSASARTPDQRRHPLTANDHGAEGARTPDLLGAIQALSQLSYSPAGLQTRPRSPDGQPSRT